MIRTQHPRHLFVENTLRTGRARVTRLQRRMRHVDPRGARCRASAAVTPMTLGCRRRVRGGFLWSSGRRRSPLVASPLGEACSTQRRRRRRLRLVGLTPAAGVAAATASPSGEATSGGIEPRTRDPPQTCRRRKVIGLGNSCSCGAGGVSADSFSAQSALHRSSFAAGQEPLLPQRQRQASARACRLDAPSTAAVFSVGLPKSSSM